MTKKQSPLLSSARAYFRLAAKARMAGNSRGGDRYEQVARRKLVEYHRAKEFSARLAERDAKARAAVLAKREAKA